MSRYSVSPELLFDRPWRVGHPFRPHCGRVRRWCIGVLLVVLCLIIGGYDYLTDSTRVRIMAQGYLTQLIGGRVEVGSARLSIFEGLRLENVRVHVDEDGSAPDSVIFNAQSIVVLYDPRSMLSGQLEATQIIAEKPRVLLAVNATDGSWNYNRLVKLRSRRPRPIVPERAPAVTLPEILLRNARLETSEMRDGKLVERGSMALDGQVLPSPDGQHFSFELQSRGTEGIGPYVTGTVDTITGGMDANLRNFEFGQDWDFGHDVQKMLPQAVREWWQRHQLAGRLDIPVVRYVPGREGEPPRFRVETDLNGVTLAVGPEEWGAKVAVAAGATSQPAERKTISLRQVSGKLVFTEGGIEVSDITGRVENNGLRVIGRYAGYGADAPFQLHISSLQTESVYIPPAPRYIESLPKPVRELYMSLRPQGSANLDVELDRQSEGGAPVVRGRVQIVDGQFTFNLFPYPMREATGEIAFGPDRDGFEIVRINNVRGRGVEGGPNRDSYATVEGIIGPLVPDTDPYVFVRVFGKDVTSEPALKRAFPPEVREALRLLGANGPDFPTFSGNFETRAEHTGSHPGRWTFDTDVALDDGAGALEGFPYPLHHVKGNIKVRDGYVDLENMQSQQGNAWVRLDGRVAWGGAGFDPNSVVDLKATPGGKPIRTVVHLKVHHVPIDGNLLAALPPSKRSWLEKLGVKGLMDVEGDISQPPPVAKPTPVVPVAAKDPDAPLELPFVNDPLDFRLNLNLVDGEMTPVGSKYSLSHITSTMVLTPDSLHIETGTAHRGEATVIASGDIGWPNDQPTVSLKAQAIALPLEQELHDLLPADAQAGWDSMRPRGTVDAELTYHNDAIGGAAGTALVPSPGTPGEGQGGGLIVQSPSDPVQHLQVTPPPPQPSPGVPAEGARVAEHNPSAGPALAQPAALGATAQTQPAETFRLVLQPRALSVNPVALPYQFDALKGALSVEGEHLIISGMTARHGDAEFAITGTGELGTRPSYNMQLTAKNVLIDRALRDAVPEPVQNIIDGLKLHGPCNFRFGKIVYRAPDPSATTAPAPANETTPAIADGSVAGDLDFSLALTLHGGGLDVGVPLDNVNGTINLDAQLHDGTLAGIGGNLDVDSVSMAGRTLSNFSADLVRSDDGNGLKLMKMQADLAGGQMAGEVDISFPNDGPSRYTMDVVLNNADVRELARETDPSIQGNLTASLSLEGAWGDPASRRGRGDVLVTGKEMYRIPLILGLLQVTNLALPIAQPFHRGSVRYSLDGQRVNFDQIELRSDQMLMTGTGHLDFGTKQVRMTFVTDNANGIQLPFINDLLKGARNELLKINVKGTITQPKVETSVMGTFTTTVDEVLKGDSGK